MNITLYFVVAVATAVCALYIKQVRPDYALCVALAGILFILSGILPKVAYIVTRIQNMVAKGSFPTEYIAPIMKIIGISYVSEISADICRDAGEEGISHHVQTFGKIAVAFVALPIVTEVFELIMGLVE